METKDWTLFAIHIKLLAADVAGVKRALQDAARGSKWELSLNQYVKLHKTNLAVVSTARWKALFNCYVQTVNYSHVITELTQQTVLSIFYSSWDYD